jgi:hypothetical protein
MAQLSEESDSRSEDSVQQTGSIQSPSNPAEMYVLQDMKASRPSSPAQPCDANESSIDSMRVKPGDVHGKPSIRHFDTHADSSTESTGGERHVASSNGPETVRSSQTSNHIKEMNQWEAFLRKHDRIVSLRIRACDVRRRCLEGRKELRRLEFFSNRGTIGPYQRHESQSKTSGSNLFDAIATLEEDEQRLDELDQAIIAAEDEMARAAPKLLRKMQESLPSMIEKHQLDFRGTASVSTEDVASALDDPLGPTAEEMAQKQRLVNKLENDVLALRGKRDRLVDIVSTCEDDQEAYDGQWNEDLSELQDLDGQIDDKLAQLVVLRTDIDHMRDQAMNGEDEEDLNLPLPTARSRSQLSRDMAFIYTAAAVTDTKLDSETSGTTIRAPTEPGSGEDALSHKPPASETVDSSLDVAGVVSTRTKSLLNLVTLPQRRAVPSPPGERPPQT